MAYEKIQDIHSKMLTIHNRCFLTLQVYVTPQQNRVDISSNSYPYKAYEKIQDILSKMLTTMMKDTVIQLFYW